MRVGRNEACPCGSGKKFKHCCEAKAARPASKGMMMLGVALAAIAAVGFIPLVIDNKPEERARPAPAAAPAPVSAPAATPAGEAFTPKPQPPGPVPPGKVWSVEHGHWHDLVAPTGAQSSSPIKIEAGPGLVATATPVASGQPTPTGNSPTSLGLVNPPTDGTKVSVNIPQPPGPVPPGKVWSPEHGHWHNVQ